MPSYGHINDEEELHKLMNATEDFDERKKIRTRLREIRDKQRDENDAKRKQREAEAQDLVKKKFERAEEEKKKKMEAYKQQAPTHERDSKYQQVSQTLIQEKKKTAEDEKAKKLAAYTSIATTKSGPDGEEVTTTTTTSTTTTQKTPGGGTKTVTKKTTESTSSGFGGVAYGKPAARPQGAKSAMATFQKADSSNSTLDVKPKGLTRSPSAIKQMLLDWTKAMTRGYEGVEVTNFSTSWNDGLAFCALIHHFFPDSFDFSQLEAKNRRSNFTLAFDTAEKQANIAPLLDVEDMVKMKNPDWKCVFTYIQSLYRHLRDHPNGKTAAVEQ